MRDQYDNDTVAVEISVRHTFSNGTVESRHESIVKVGSDCRPQWLNRRVVAAVEETVERTHRDFGVTDDDIRLGRARDFLTARPVRP